MFEILLAFGSAWVTLWLWLLLPCYFNKDLYAMLTIGNAPNRIRSAIWVLAVGSFLTLPWVFSRSREDLISTMLNSTNV